MRPSLDQSSSEMPLPLKGAGSGPPIVETVNPESTWPPPPALSTRFQSQTRSPSGKKATVRVSGFRSSATLPLVRLKNFPVPTWVLHASHVPAPSQRKATYFPSRDMAAWCSAPLKSVNLVNVAPSSGFRQTRLSSWLRISGRLSCHAAAAPIASRPAPAAAHQASLASRGRGFGRSVLARPESSASRVVGARASVSSMSSRASPMSRKRRFASFSRQRWSSRRTLTGVCAGRAFQSGSRSRIAAIVSGTVSPRNAG